MKKKNLFINFLHASRIRMFVNTHIYLGNNYAGYFVGDKTLLTDSNKSHLDLTTQSAVTLGGYDSQRLIKINKNAQLFTYRASLFYYKKIKFVGKGYKIKKIKIKKSFKLFFGHSHLQYVFGGGLIFRRLSKYRLFLISNNKKKLNRASSLVVSARVLSRYTKRGLRTSRYFILKRPGKKSTY